MIQTRRTILKHSVAALTTATLPQPPLAKSPAIITPGSVANVDIEDPRLKHLITSAVNAALAEGASYADARLTHAEGLRHGITSPDPVRSEFMAFGVRALYQGYWGFASSPIWTEAEAVRLGQAATTQARVNVFESSRDVDLALLTTPRSGQWVMPVKDDPFNIASDEIYDFLKGLESFCSRLEYFGGSFGVLCVFGRTQKVFGSSLGQHTSQRLYGTYGLLSFAVRKDSKGGVCDILDRLTLAGMGFEYLRDRPLREYILEAYEETLRDIELPIAPVDPGRYTTLINPIGVAGLVGKSIGIATQIDRAMGYEANAGGTSYITDPAGMVGNFKVGNSLVQVTGSRSETGSIGCVEWDDEGVEPMPFVLVKDGIITNLQTNREGCGWIKKHYAETNQPFQSFGCAQASSGLEVPLIFNADLTLQSGSDRSNTLDSLREMIDKGIEFKSPRVEMDFQQTTGFLRGKSYEITKGKRTAILANSGILFRTPEIWNNLMHLGGADSLDRFGFSENKGEPGQSNPYSVTSPPAVFKEMTTIDIKRKA